MCVNLLAIGGTGGIAQGGTLQLAAGAFGAVGDLAAGATRARMNRADARAIEAAAAAKAGRVREAAVLELGSARASAAASGVSVASGSVLEAERSIVQRSERDALSLILSGANQAESLRTGARYYELGGLATASDTLLEGVNRWTRTRRRAPSTAESNPDWAPGEG